MEENRMAKKSEHVAKKIVKGFKELSKALSENAPIAEKFTCRFMDEIQRNPEYWRKRMRDSIRVKAI